MPTAPINGIELAYWDSGGESPAVLLSHGFLMDHTMFDAQVAALTPEFRVITWDERGFGETRATGPFTYWDSAEDALALLTHLGIERAVIGGMSQGGFLSLRAALLAPHRVRALILLDTQAGPEDVETIAGYDLLRDTWMEHGPAAVQEVVAGIILGPGDWPGWYAKWGAQDRDQFAIAYDTLIGREDITDRLGEITCPALIAHGTDDAAIPMAKAEALRDGLGGPVTLAPIPGGGHASNVTHPDVLNPPLVEFVRSITS
jgi:3-oxoadipate enol-lactonase